jgi:hypothetical protein
MQKLNKIKTIEVMKHQYKKTTQLTVLRLEIVNANHMSIQVDLYNEPINNEIIQSN